MSVGGRADHYRIHLGIVKDLVIICADVLNAEASGPFTLGIVHEWIGNCINTCFFYTVCDAFGVNLANSSGTDDSYFDHCKPPEYIECN